MKEKYKWTNRTNNETVGIKIRAWNGITNERGIFNENEVSLSI